jgi:hypothetical protein
MEWGKISSRPRIGNGGTNSSFNKKGNGGTNSLFNKKGMGEQTVCSIRRGKGGTNSLFNKKGKRSVLAESHTSRNHSNRDTIKKCLL